jgi:hypothetical protein
MEFPAAEGASQIQPARIPGMSQKANPAMSANNIAAQQLRANLKDRIQGQ